MKIVVGAPLLSIALMLPSLAQAQNCTLSTALRWQPIQRVEFQEDASGATMTFLDAAIGMPIIFELDRRVVVRVDDNQSVPVLMGMQSITQERISNTIALSVGDPKVPGGVRAVSIESTVLISGFNPEKTMILGFLRCGQ